MKSYDVRTTPRWARIPVLVILSLVTVYLVVCFHFALREGAPSWSYFGGWKMFTSQDTWHAAVEAEGLIDGAWTEIDLEALFPSKWDSGHRYQRGPFRRSGNRMRTLAASTCHRLDNKPTTVRFYEIKWRRTLGQQEQPRTGKIKKKRLVEWRCGQRLKLPGGRFLQ